MHFSRDASGRKSSFEVLIVVQTACRCVAPQAHDLISPVVLLSRSKFIDAAIFILPAGVL